VNPNLFVRPLVLSAALLLGTTTAAPVVAAAGAEGSVQGLEDKLNSPDFRMRVQAALLLGKTGDARALKALTARLGDESVAVRAAAAAALGTLRDPAALPALRRAERDSNSAVERRIKATIEILETRLRDQITHRRNAKILVKFERFDSQSESAEAVGAAAQASREALSKFPQIAVLNPTEDPQVASKRHDRPVIMMRASVRRLSATKEGSDTVISADVEFLVERFPERAIMGRLSGNASVKSNVDTSRERVKLQEEAVGAAVSSALSRSGQALLAAAGHG
jgi:hypothetical protein